MSLLIVSFLAGILTILAPCVLPLLPIILGASVKDSKDKYRPYIIILSLILSIVIFSLLLKASTIFIGVDPIFWKGFSGVILIVFGILTIFPNLWKNFSTKIGFIGKSNKNFGESSQKKGYFGAIMVGISLGPVFSSCSPTYSIILAVILPTSFFFGLLNLFAYSLGLGVMLLAISLLGQKFVRKLKGVSSPNSLFKKFLGILFLVIGLAIISGFDKVIETKVLNSGYFDISKIEQIVLDKIENKNNISLNNSNMENNKINNIFNKNNTKNLKLKEAYFAGGCFWCMEGIFESQPGVKEVIVGYIGGNNKTANYTDVSSGNTAHREGIKIIYNPEIISYEKLTELFWTQIDPTDPEGQFSDKGFQYTTAMFYSNNLEKEILKKSKKSLEKSGKFNNEIVTKILEKPDFFEAEEYHQDYYKKSEFRYKLYKKGSGRAGFIEKNWEEKISELEKENISKNKGYLNYSEEILKNAKQKNIVLFFHADWCSTCKSFEEHILADKIPDNILILKVNYDTENELKKKYNIVTQTSFVIVDNEGNLKKRWIGARNISDIIKKINEVNQNNGEISKTYTKEELKNMLTPLQYKVTQEGGTEPPFNNLYWDNHEEGIYVDIIDKTPLFSSTDKFDSGTGWPSFTKPIEENFLTEEDDYKLISKRTEIKSDISHLGHVFDDGPSEFGGKRYCINSAALDFIPKSELKGTKYEKYLSLF